MQEGKSSDRSNRFNYFPFKGVLIYAIEGGNRNRRPRLSFHSRERNIPPSGVTFSLQTGFSDFQ